MQPAWARRGGHPDGLSWLQLRNPRGKSSLPSGISPPPAVVFGVAWPAGPAGDAEQEHPGLEVQAWHPCSRLARCSLEEAGCSVKDLPVQVQPHLAGGRPVAAVPFQGVCPVEPQKDTRNTLFFYYFIF